MLLPWMRPGESLKFSLEKKLVSSSMEVAISGGLVLAAPTAITGLLDWLDIPKGTPARTVATVHLLTMVTATVLFALTWLAQRPGYNDEEIKTLALVLGLVAEATLTIGGYLGGAIVFVYGHRVLKWTDIPVADALTPGKAEESARLPGRGL